MKNTKTTLRIFVSLILFSTVVQPMFRSTRIHNHSVFKSNDPAGLFKIISADQLFCRKNYVDLYKQLGRRSHTESLYQADLQLYDIRVLKTKCNALYRDELFIKQMVHDPSVEKRVQGLFQDLEEDRIKLETFILIVNKMSKK